MKLYAQNPELVWDYSGSLIAASSINSGSFVCAGYARLVGIVYSDASLSGACGVMFQQSSTSIPNWDADSRFALSASSGSGFSIEPVGRFAQIALFSGATCAASTLRAYFWLRPV